MVVLQENGEKTVLLRKKNSNKKKKKKKIALCKVTQEKKNLIELVDTLFRVSVNLPQTSRLNPRFLTN